MSSRGNNNRPLKEWLQIFASSPQLRDRLYQTRIQTIWEESMGPLVVKYTRNLYLDNDKLFVHVDSAPLRSELYRMRDSIKEKINQSLGENLISDIILK